MSPEGALILAVEDEPRNAALLRAVLEPAGYRLVIADSLAAARAWLAAEHPDLMLLDIGLPDGSGLDLARELRSSPTTAELPILVASARVLAADQEAASQAGANAFLAKPIRPRVLLDAVVDWLGGREGGHEDGLDHSGRHS
jgi:CheY-like chemotaxis protein